MLKANVRRRILAWSNWAFGLPLQSDSPDDAGAPEIILALSGRRGKAAGLLIADGFAVCVRPMSLSHSPRLMAS